jgi:hypothetical protein
MSAKPVTVEYEVATSRSFATLAGLDGQAGVGQVVIVSRRRRIMAGRALLRDAARSTSARFIRWMHLDI